MTTAYRELIDTFGEGWEKGDLERICSVFTPDAVFETSFRSGEIFEVGPWFATEFRCTFRRRRTGEWVDARGAIFCETKDGKISEMRMYWHRYAGGREEPKP
jgi:ketosteroid isomerase-like protein